MNNLSIVLPAKNEAASLEGLLPELRTAYPDAEVIVVDDGSGDDTARICRDNSVTVVSHMVSLGNGAAIKAGARRARGEVIVFMDSDGQHQVSDIARLLEEMEKGFDMVVGARNVGGQASLARLFGNTLYNRLASLMVGHPVEDLTSGFRAVRAAKFRQFLELLPNGFSYPTTITMAFFRSGYQVRYIPLEVKKRIGKSHIRLFRDGSRFFLIIFKIATLYSPLKIFFPISLAFFFIASGYYSFTYLTIHRFTNMSALLYCTSVLVFLIGLVSEQLASLQYQQSVRSSQDNEQGPSQD